LGQSRALKPSFTSPLLIPFGFPNQEPALYCLETAMAIDGISPPSPNLPPLPNL
jgi:hypothetical protein